jgi:hypothetical protein
MGYNEYKVKKKKLKMESRLERRHKDLVKRQMSHKQNSINGLNLLIKDTKSFSEVQSAWRFYNNEKVDIESLNNPILEKGISRVLEENSKYVLVMHDWSLISYRNHDSKEDCIESKRSKTKESKSKGYDLQSSLVVSELSGNPIMPIAQNLKTSKRVYSSYKKDIDKKLTRLEELSDRIKYIDERLDKSKKKVHIVDREGDSIEFIREIYPNSYFIIRGMDNRSVEHNNEKIKQKELSNKLDNGRYVKSIKYGKKEVDIYVNSVDIKITRDAIKRVKDTDGKNRQEKIKGETVECKLVVERLIDQDGKIVATWILLTNLQEVESKVIGLWYYYRWKIESYFKLLKSSGFNLERWQQRKPDAIFRRLLIVSYACLLVWEIENSNNQNMIEIQKFLVKLSGRLISRDKISTSPALLAGIWSFLSMIDVMQLYEFDELIQMKSKLSTFWNIEL